MIHRTPLILIFLLSGSLLFAQNPISPPGVYIADPTARVWEDGNLYIYGSLDKSCDYYCSHTHPVLYTHDLRSWQLAEDVFMSKGDRDEVPYNDNLLFAPSAAYRDGVYYLYYCQPDRSYAEGVAISESPLGPFRDGKPIQTYGYNQIDPDVFIDEDGEAYYCWGQFTLKMARMNRDLMSLDSTTIRDQVLTEDTHHFHEGAFMCRINGLYYLIYADISRGDAPTCIGYATSENPFGPYEYRGVIIDNDGCNPNNWNNHGSMVKFRDQYYIFYHRSTHACNKMRKACLEPLEILADGTIPEVEMTSQGAGGPLDARSVIQAEWACLLFGNVRIISFQENAECLSGIHSGDRFAFKYLDFKTGPDSLEMRLKPGREQGEIRISLDKPWHQSVAKLTVQPLERPEWVTLSVPVSRVQGVHAVWISCSGVNGEIPEIDWFRFK